MSTVIDYAGRRSDFVAFQVLYPNLIGREEVLEQTLAGVQSHTKGGALVAGLQKLVQRFLLTLLKPIGTQVHRPLDGTAFLTEARQGLWRTPADVTQSFYSALLDVRRQLTADELDTDPDDERYGTATLAGVAIAGDTVGLRITLTSLAGATYTFLTPIQVVTH